MAKSVSAADANRRFSQLLRGVREEGAAYVITSHGKPIAQLLAVPAVDEQRARHRERLLKRLRSLSASGKRSWRREELYERSR